MITGKKNIQDALRSALTRGVVRITENVRNEAISLVLNTTKTGRVYSRGGVEHRASAPGEPPASDTGQLVNSITTEYDLPKLTGRVVVKSAHGAHLEFGTKNMEPRPFMRPALANVKPSVPGILTDEVKRALK